MKMELDQYGLRSTKSVIDRNFFWHLLALLWQNIKPMQSAQRNICYLSCISIMLSRNQAKIDDNKSVFHQYDVICESEFLRK